MFNQLYVIKNFCKLCNIYHFSFMKNFKCKNIKKQIDKDIEINGEKHFDNWQPSETSFFIC